MPRRTDIKRILIIGSGPIVIGQACEFDYSGTQGARALTEEGYEVVLVNSNPATIMTDPETAARTYIEPLEPRTLRRILERERPDAVLPTLGGQTALNLALHLADDGSLEAVGARLIGASPIAIRTAEDRGLFKAALESVGLACPRSGYARSVADARRIAGELGYPVVLRASFTLGGGGSGVVYGAGELDASVEVALQASPTHEVLVEESVLGWKEIELEVIRDRADNFIVVCAIENLDPMGVHTGDSITVAPTMTITDREYQRMRDAARLVMRAVGVETGGSNVQFAIDPRTGRMVVIEMNPRVSRSSALASKATGYPIAKVAARLAVGYRLDELRNDITGTSAAFEPAIDYAVVKWPRFAFEKFPGADARLGTSMKSVGEAMAIGRSFREALQKAARSLELDRDGLVSLHGRVDYPALALRVAGVEARDATAALRALVAVPSAERLFYVADAMRAPARLTDEELHQLTRIDPWFVAQVRGIVQAEAAIRAGTCPLAEAKRAGFSDGQIAELTGASLAAVAARREAEGVLPTFARVDTCAAEIATRTPYLYGTYESESESDPSERRKVIILGAGPNRVGQGIEFDYCCVHAALALRALGIEAIMVNSNPETVSTDYDTSDRLYLEPVALETVLAVAREEGRRGTLEGVIVQLGGQTPLRLARALETAGVRVLGTSADAIDRAEDRGRFDALLTKLHLRRPRGFMATTLPEARSAVRELGLPVLLRPSYVLGGRAMHVCVAEDQVETALEDAFAAGAGAVLVDEFLSDALELDVDCLADGRRVVVCGVIEHVEQAGIHSGDSAGVLPPRGLSPDVMRRIDDAARRIALELGVVGLMNVQMAVRADEVFVLEVNPRASRTVPFVSKATGLPIARLATKLMVGHSLDALGVQAPGRPAYVAVKESVFSFHKLPGSDPLLGPEMRSTGEVMALAPSFAVAFGKSQLAAGNALPRAGSAFFSVRGEHQAAATELAERLRRLGFRILGAAGRGLADALTESEPSFLVVDTMHAPEGGDVRRAAMRSGVAYVSTMAAAHAVVDAIEASLGAASEVRSLQEWHAEA